MALLLGTLLLQGFEAPSGLRYGGCQALAVHRLPGGTRVIDAMGPDDSDITWRGFLSGLDAADRARQLDSMRIAGVALPLAWNDISLNVIIKRLSFTFASPWWIQYEIICTVSNDPLATNAPESATASSLVLSDIAAAGQWINVTTLSSALASNNAMIIGTQANAMAKSAIDATRTSIEASINAAGIEMASVDVAKLTQAAGALATMAAANGFLSRAAVNLANAGM